MEYFHEAAVNVFCICYSSFQVRKGQKIVLEKYYYTILIMLLFNVTDLCVEIVCISRYKS